MAIIDINNATRVIQTAAEWAADSETYDEGKWLVTSDEFYASTDQPKFKLANGSDTWSNLDYMPIGDGGVTSVSGTAPISVANGTTTPNVSISQADPVSDGYISSSDWNVFNEKQDSITLTTVGSSGAATLVGETLNIPQYAGGGGAVDSVNGETGVVVLTTGDIPEDTDANYVTDAEKTVIDNTSGTNTGDQDISGIATNASAISTLDGEVVKKADYTPAHSILVQQSGTGTPTALSLSDSQIVGKNGADIKGLSASEVRTIINVEDGSDVTDTANVTAAGALMDSEVTNLDQVKAFDSADYATAAQGALADSAVQDLTDLGVTATSTELNYVDGVTSNVQTQLDDKQKKAARQTLTDGATINWDVNSGNIATVTLGGNRTIAAPTNLRDDTLVLKIVQDGTGSRTLTWNAIFKWSEGTAPELTTTAGAIDIVTFIYDGTNLYGSALTNFS